MNLPAKQIPLSPDEVLAENLQKLLQTRGLTEAKLARYTKIPQPTLHKVLTGKTEDPRISTLQLLANFFGVTIDTLYSTGMRVQETSQVHVQAVPVISWGDCLKANEFINTLTPANWNNWLTVEQIGKSLYGITTKSSMEPRFPKGSILIIDSQEMPSDGDLIVVHYPNTQEATLRELALDGPVKLLFPINSHSDKEPLAKDIKILGVVIQSRFNF